MKNNIIKDIIIEFLIDTMNWELEKDQNKMNVNIIDNCIYLLNKFYGTKKITDEEIEEKVNKLIKQIEEESKNI